MSSKDKMLITGGHPLMGEITVSGGKNTAVAVIPAVLLCDEPCTIENLPDIDDVHALIEILQRLGAETEYVPGKYLTVDPRGATGCRVPFSLTKRLAPATTCWARCWGAAAGPRWPIPADAISAAGPLTSI